ncbi:MAG: MFS transporter [Eubacteriaceae bacterium]|nr:MFS transporter [Eubacteriaceae bacterium]
MTETQALEQKTMPKSFPYLWMFHTLGQMFGMTVAMGQMTFYWTEIVGLTPAFIASFLAVARIIDLVMSVVAGPIVQKTNTKMGQFRPWVMGCVIVVNIGQFLIFINPNVSTGTKGLIAGLGYILQGVPMNFYAAANNGIMMKVTGSDMQARMQVSMMSMRGMSISSILTSAISLPFIMWINNTFTKINPYGYLIVNCIFGGLWICTTAIVFIMTKPYDEYVPEMVSVQSPKVWDIYKDIIKNSQIWVLFIQNIILWVSFNSIVGMGLYYWLYSVGTFNGQPPRTYQPLSMVISQSVSLFASFVVAPQGKKLKKKTASMLATSWGIACNILHGLFSGGGANQANPIIYIAIASISTLGMAISQSVGMNLWLDAAEKQLYETGIDTRAAAMGVSSISMKIASFLASPITPILLKIVGYDNSAVATGGFAVCEYPERIIYIIGFAGAFMSTLQVLVLFFGYKIKDEDAAFYAAENQKRMMERMAAANNPSN